MYTLVWQFCCQQGAVKAAAGFYNVEVGFASGESHNSFEANGLFCHIVTQNGDYYYGQTDVNGFISFEVSTGEYYIDIFAYGYENYGC